MEDIKKTRKFLNTLLKSMIELWGFDLREALKKRDFKAASEVILSHKGTIGKLEKMLGRNNDRCD